MAIDLAALKTDTRFSAVGKVCNQLIEMAGIFDRQGESGIRIDVNLKQETLANLLGMHLGTIVNIAKDLKNRGLIDHRSGHYDAGTWIPNASDAGNFENKKEKTISPKSNFSLDIFRKL